MRRRVAHVITVMALAATISPPTQAQCIGDCGGDGKVTVDEVLTLVNLALSGAAPTTCTAGDANHTHTITIDEILTAVNNALAALRLAASGMCLRPGQTESLIPCADGTAVQVFRCDDPSRCLGDPTALTMLAAGTVEGGTFSLVSCSMLGSPLVFAAQVDPQSETQFRIVDFGFVRAGGAASRTRWLPADSDVTIEGIVLSPVSEAAVRVLDENGLQRFDAAGATAVIDAIENANTQTQFTGQDPAAAAMRATDTANHDPVVQATITANRIPQAFAIQLLGAGPKGTDPAPGVRVIRHDPTTGAVLADMVTDANGFANFGDIASDRTTISIVTNTSGNKQIETFVNLLASPFPPASPFKYNLGGSIDHPTLAVVNVTLTNLPIGSSQFKLIAGRRNGRGQDTSSDGSFPSFPIQQLQSDGRISFLAVALDSTGVVRGCGSLLDLDPTTINSATLVVPVNTSPTSISFTASEPVGFISDVTQILRKGLLFRKIIDSGQAPVTFGTLNTCSLPGADGFELSFGTPETSSASDREIGLIKAVLPSSVNVTVPSLSIDTLVRSADGKTISWMQSGTDLGKLDFADTHLDWQSAGTAYNWDLLGDPAASTSVSLPTLPADLSDRVPPANGAGVRLDLAGLDKVNGFDDVFRKFSAAGGDGTPLTFGSTESVLTERTVPVLTVTKDGTGSGTVLSSPAGIDCGATCAANFPPNSSVMLTAVADTGSTFVGWSGSCGGAGNQNHVSVTMNDNQSCTATFSTGRFSDNGDGTITDNQTGLMWEKKDDAGGIHDWDNFYTWCLDANTDFNCDNAGNPPDGTAFTGFLATLNTPPCFAGHCDWRLPTMAGSVDPTGQAAELESILAAPYPCNTNPCVPAAFNTNCTPGCNVTGCSCTASSFYWSGSTFSANPGNAGFVNFYNGHVYDDGGFKTSALYVRAVR